MNIGCTAASPSAGGASVVTTPPLGNAVSTAAHYRLGRRSRRSSSSGASSSSSCGNGATAATPSHGVNASRKRRRHSTLSSGIASGSEEEGERAPPTFRLRLGSYVSDFRLTRTRSHSPSSPLYQATPASPTASTRQSHPLRIQTTALPDTASAQQQNEPSRVPPVAWAIPSPTLVSSASAALQDERDVEMDLDVQSTFQAMQVDSPIASPSATTNDSARTSFFPSQASAIAPFQPQARSSLSPIPASLLSPFSTDTRYPRSPSPLSPPSSASLPSMSLIAHASITTVSPGVFPSSALLASRRTSRQPSSIAPQQHTPASPSPLARTISFPAPASASFQDTQPVPHQYPTLASPFVPHLNHSSSLEQESPTRSRSNSTPSSPVIEAAAGVPPSPVRRHSDGRPSPLRLRAPL
ncbi:hypothetical protein PSEUBRA_000223 [Kalmanozyma brasiliensis GHG001]|uniref:uncharacterized protein n=1 Tax=Kalmanozyma brasiliensis (strain GHG001) TaxID=1365824 RepID=UPI0028682119|nr:uncharacterized protein PSEUBRA_000223 [Kalmanozyma brasiliensis GHG001]KAF6766789.1 hypothetical protein PSEUBRA_000223 [Kalmanozyma brasiliensis GHG001]